MKNILSRNVYLPDTNFEEDFHFTLPIHGCITSSYQTNSKDNEIILEPIVKEILSISEQDKFIHELSGQLPILEHKKPTLINTKIFDYLENESVLPEKVIFGIDPIEQHGPFLPIGTDIFITEAIIEEVLRKHKEIVKVTSFNYTLLRWALALGMSISISENLLELYLERYIDLLYKKGARQFIIISTHLAPNSLNSIKTIINKSKRDIKVIFPMESIELTNLDPHAGLIESSLIHFINKKAKLHDLYRYLITNPSIMSKEKIIYAWNLGFEKFVALVKKENWNGIVGNFTSIYDSLISEDVFAERMQDIGKQNFDVLIKYVTNKLSNK